MDEKDCEYKAWKCGCVIDEKDYSFVTVCERHKAAKGCVRSEARTVREVEDRPMESLRFRDFARLKSGRDKFSAMRLPELLALVVPSAETLAALTAQFPEETDQAKVLRWMARGLSADKAMRKVATDLEITANAVDARNGIAAERRRKQVDPANRLTADEHAARDMADKTTYEAFWKSRKSPPQST